MPTQNTNPTPELETGQQSTRHEIEVSRAIGQVRGAACEPITLPVQPET
jgi:hypothetical protein